MAAAFYRKLLGALALVLAVAACGGGGTTTANGGDDTQTAQQETQEETQEAQAQVQTASSPVGQILTDAEGRTLYMFTQDSENESACYDECAEAWPPLVVSGEPAGGSGVEASLLGTTERENGDQQVTYAGMPLYYFASDESSGDITGQAVEDVWWVVSPSGDPIMEQAPAEDEGTGSRY